MHTYQYHCNKCGHRFECQMTLVEHEHASEKPECPKCHTHDVKQDPSAVDVVTSKKA